MKRLVTATIMAWLALASQVFAQVPVAALYRVKSSEVPLGDGDKPGDVRRIIQPFGNWTKICDENLRKKKQVCNISQIITDQSGSAIFSWSLAGTDGGDPVMILRGSNGSGIMQTAHLDFGSVGKPVDVLLDSCNEKQCLGLMYVSAEMKKIILKGPLTRITVQEFGTQPTTFEAPLSDLAKALLSIK